MTVIVCQILSILHHVEVSRGKAVKQVVCDRGYRGKCEVNGTQIILPKKALKKDTRYQRTRSEDNAKGGWLSSQLLVI